MKSDRPPPPTASLGFGIAHNAGDLRRRQEPNLQGARKAKVMVVDDDPALRRLLVTRLGAANYAVETAGTARAALDACVLSRPNLVITELRLSDTEGLAFLKELKSRWPQLAVIVLTAHGTIAEAVEATQCGAFGYLVKPVGKDELLGQVARATAVSSFALSDPNWRANIVSRSQLMEDRLGIANRAAASDEPVLLTGENGTGKELLARAIHAASARREKPFVVVSCRESDREALTAELFSALERALDGTMLLDEVGELSLELQARLAKAITRGDGAAAARAGGGRANVRLMCTTSRDLKALMDAGAFLSELYYQINILPIEIPPLGRRREDIPLLVSHFLEQANEPGEKKKIYSPKAIELLATTDWPGNVRQLFDLVKQNVALSHSEVISKEVVERSLGEDAGKIPTYDEARDRFSRDYLVENLQRTAGNVTQAARLAKRSRTDFYKLLARYRLHAEDFKHADSANRKDRSDEKDGEKNVEKNTGKSADKDG